MNKNTVLIISAIIMPFLILVFNIFVYSIADLISSFTKPYPSIIGFALGVVLYAGPSVMVISFLQTDVWKKLLGAIIFSAIIIPIIFVLAVFMSCEFKGICL